MTEFQTALIEKLSADNTVAKFNGAFLNCKVAVKSGTKTKWQKFSFVFDSASDGQGARLVAGSLKGAYSETFSESAFAIIVAHSEEIAQRA